MTAQNDNRTNFIRFVQFDFSLSISIEIGRFIQRKKKNGYEGSGREGGERGADPFLNNCQLHSSSKPSKAVHCFTIIS